MENMTRTTARPRTRGLVVAALLAALLAASVLITIPIGAVPLTLQVFVVVLAALMLEPIWAGAAVGVYLVLGAIGLPVFSGMLGGPGVLFGPTGGYLLGFFVGAVAGSLVRSSLSGRNELLGDVAGAGVCIALIYLFGWIQLHIVTGMDWPAAFVAGVAPFVLIDIAKAAVAIGVARALRRAGFTQASAS